MYQQYDKAVQTVLEYLIEQGFSKTPRKYFSHTTREFKKYLEEKYLEYSLAIAQDWVATLKSSLPRTKFLYFRRSLALIDDVVRNGAVTNTRFSYENAPLKYRVPECYRELLATYLDRRRQEGNQPSTLQMDSIACTRFLLFLQSKSITNIALITPEIIKEYHKKAEHKTAEGKNAYNCRIRGFVRFLAMKSL